MSDSYREPVLRSPEAADHGGGFEAPPPLAGPAPEPYGIAAEFATPEAVVAAAQAAYARGYRQMDAYSPIPVEGLAEAIGFRKNMMPPIVLAGGLIGGLTGFGMQTFSAVFHYPIIVGGRPYFSWPAFIPVTFELTVLLSAFAAVFGMIALNGLPRPHHPIFNAPNFERASQDRFFLCIQSNDPMFDLQSTRSFLEGLGAEQVSQVNF